MMWRAHKCTSFTTNHATQFREYAWSVEAVGFARSGRAAAGEYEVEDAVVKLQLVLDPREQGRKLGVGSTFEVDLW